MNEIEETERLLAGCFWTTVAGAVLLVLLGIAAAVLGRHLILQDEVPAGYLGSPARGRELVSAYGCTSCHDIPGAAPRGIVGPPLAHIATRSYLAGRIANEPITMEVWIQHPQSVKPGTDMPDLGVSDRDARDMAAYLATLK